MASYTCEVCDYRYDEALGEPHEGFPAGTAWAQLPDDWACPDCGVREKVDFVAVTPSAASAGPGGDAGPTGG